MARILLGVTGGIAAYKAVELVRLATAAGHAVRVVQTPTSRRFVGSATFAAVTGAPVLSDEFEGDPARGAYPGEAVPDRAPISHLALAQRADVYMIAPASANTLAKLATGQADSLLTSAALACPAPLVLAPAMNDRMWSHPATVANVETLRARGAEVIEPGSGRLASHGEAGAGRLPEPTDLLAHVEARLGHYTPRSLDGLRVLVTAGGTREPIDAVRYVGNRSSGRMGVALAEEAARRGARVTVIAANVTLRRPEGVDWIDVETAAELERAASDAFAVTDVLLMAAAVADFRPAAVSEGKLSKTAADGSAHDELMLRLTSTTDVLSELASGRRGDQTVVGFAAEHGSQGLDRAREKLARKRLDAIVLNDIARAEIGFDSLENEVTVITGYSERTIRRSAKAAVAAGILDDVEALRVGPRSAQPDGGQR